MRPSELHWLDLPDTRGRGVALVHSGGWTMLAFGIVGLAAGAVFLGPSTSLAVACAGAIAVGAGAIALARALAAASRQERQFEARNRELEGERERFQALSESSRDLITEIDLDGNLLYTSPNHTEVLGWTPEELAGPGWRKLIFPEDLAFANIRNEVQAHAGEIAETIYRVRHRDGTTRWLESAGHAFIAGDGGTRLVSVTRDITQRVTLESQLRQSQKLEAVGRLAGGVAHDFNNLLTVIILYSEMLLSDERFRDEPSLREIHAAGERAQSLTRQLLAFSRQQELHPRVLDLEDALRNVESLLLRLLGEHIALSFRPHPEPLNVFIDSNELEQVVVNLALNARDAMPEGGRIEISTHVDEGQPEPGEEAKESWAVIEVRDEGVGMSPELQSHIFEPFYTTKEVGEGTGLGLAMVHGIVEQSGGLVEVESEPGVGSCFRICLRRVEAIETEQREAPSPELEAGSPATLLLAEDDPAVRQLVRTILEGSGYEVIEAATGLEALSVLRHGEEQVDLLLTDMVMPEMGGRALRRELAEIRPGLPTVFMSGYPERDRDGSSDDPLPGDRLIGKPFTRGELLSTIRSLLDEQAPDATPQTRRR